VTRGQLPQRAGLLGLNGGEAAAAVPPRQYRKIHKVNTTRKSKQCKKQQNKTTLV